MIYISNQKFITIVFLFLIVFSSAALLSQSEEVVLETNEEGHRILIDGNPFFIKGINWDYFPIGTTYNFDFWTQSDDFIEKALDYEMGLLQKMGINAIRQYTGVPARWISHIYEEYGIFTILNHPFGRYGLEINNQWKSRTVYKDDLVREKLLKELEGLTQSYRNTPGLLLYLLGNENNYGLFWEGSETEDIPLDPFLKESEAAALYKLFNEAARLIESIDPYHPVAFCNGDLQYLDLIQRYCPDIDILGTNMYRGESFGDTFDEVKKTTGKAILFTEFGADAYNMITGVEDSDSQARYFFYNWKEIFENAYGYGKNGNCIGGFTFQFSDGWWKYGQTRNLSVHDNIASWSNGGYIEDYTEGRNNMNEEWFGICAKGHPDAYGHYELIPRKAYYVIKDINKYKLFDGNYDIDELNEFFNRIEVSHFIYRAKSK